MGENANLLRRKFTCKREKKREKTLWRELGCFLFVAERAKDAGKDVVMRFLCAQSNPSTSTAHGKGLLTTHYLCVSRRIYAPCSAD